MTTDDPTVAAKAKTRDAWLSAAFSALAGDGVEGVRVEVLAKRLHVTKGSFYWHFRDRAALTAAMLESWRERRIEAIKAQTRLDGATPPERLRTLLSLYMDRGNPRGMAIELAVRDWARHDEQARAAVAAVDRERLACVSDLFAAMGLSPQEAFARAHLFYSFVFGDSLLVHDHAVAPFDEARAICARLLIPADDATPP
ncbi:TetR/AcrR family transcriptional regulator [Azospirillum halopraeferens]|uniref:TetR/AcrR family transcriptional regulator n=1 Tax=Azospirillum halopraeferens TaxID=34010 RepID=UPI0004080422|nr:TetR/AcrR family transcriptional regulator [Azospirillum halopraeferens]